MLCVCMNRVMRTPTFCICENKDGDRAVDLRLGFRYIDSTFEGDSRIIDNGFISQKVLLDLVLFIMPHEDPDITYFWCIYH